jgi:hypothetical protein
MAMCFARVVETLKPGAIRDTYGMSEEVGNQAIAIHYQFPPRGSTVIAAVS